MVNLIKGWSKKDPNISAWRQGMGTLYGGGPTSWADDFSVAMPARKPPVVAPTLPAAMDMVVEIEELIRKLSSDEY